MSNINPTRIEKNAPPLLIAGLSEKYPSGKPFNAPAQWEAFVPHLGTFPCQKGNVAYGLCLILANNGGIEYICGVEITDTDNLPEGFSFKHLPGNTYAVFVHDGHVSTLRNTLDQIHEKWTPVSGFEPPEGEHYFFERYGEKFDPVKGEGDIEIWIPVKI